MKPTPFSKQQMDALAGRFLEAWNTQDVERVLSCYTDDLVYRDPNTRGPVRGSAGMRRYLTRLFAEWRMHWTVREVFPLAAEAGGAFLWHATFQRSAGGEVVEADGMDLVLLADERISRNEVYFDRVVLAQLAATAR